MKHLAVPVSTGTAYIYELRQHIGHRFYADFESGGGNAHKKQYLIVEAVSRDTSQVRLRFENGIWFWFPVRALWVRGDPQCLTCEG